VSCDILRQWDCVLPTGSDRGTVQLLLLDFGCFVAQPIVQPIPGEGPFQVLGANTNFIQVTDAWVWVHSQCERGGHLLFHNCPEPIALIVMFGHCVG